jgi:hypothetical protein
MLLRGSSISGQMIKYSTVPPSKGGCKVCWCGEERGLLVWDSTAGGGWVHRSCLDYFDVETVREYEEQYID